MVIHKHDYQMEFEKDGLDYVMRCSCGDVQNMAGAAQKQGTYDGVGGRSMGTGVICVAALLIMLAIIVWISWP